ncbi:MAG TPA: amidohydrolase family protein [Nitrolancea sp.]|nr:amidohydrolase family protein [Nitrolancea sp.]
MSFTPDRLREEINEIILLDHHCHAPLKLTQQLEPLTLRATFTESADRDVQDQDVPNTTGYRTMIRWLAGLLGADPTENAVLTAREEIEPARYHRLLADDARLGPLLNDYLFQQERCYTSSEWEEMTGCPVYGLLRIETLAEEIIAGSSSWEGFRQDFGQALAASVANNGVGFKSIAAYRTGLDIQPIDAATASAAYHEYRAEVNRGDGERVRLAHKPLIDALIWETLEVAAELEMPLQFHVALGDDDVYLPTSNPVLLRSIFREPRYRQVPIVMLHCYPFVREAAYLCGIYPNAYIDLGLTVPLAGSNCAALIAEAIGIAPLHKILASSDGHAVPEFQWFAARLWRSALVESLARVVDQDMMTDREAIEAAALILHANSEQIYSGLDA